MLLYVPCFRRWFHFLSSTRGQFGLVRRPSPWARSCWTSRSAWGVWSVSWTSGAPEDSDGVGSNPIESSCSSLHPHPGG